MQIKIFIGSILFIYYIIELIITDNMKITIILPSCNISIGCV